MCYRKKAGINTNMHVESFHRLLKYVYMKGKVNKRVDKCLHLLLKIARDKAYERLIKSEKGKISHRIACIRQRHKTSLEMSTDLVEENGDDCWKVVSSSNPLVCYEVCKEDCSCSATCSMRCTQCDICIHQYSCTCPDSLVRLTICKHIHLLSRKLCPDSINRSKGTPTYVIRSDQESKDQNNAKILQEVTIPSKKILASALDLNKNIDTLKSLIIQSSDTGMLNHVNALVCRAINVIQMTSPSSMDFKNASPVTQNIEPQQSFSSQRKRSRKTTVRMAKPSSTRKLSIQQSLITNNSITSEEEQKLGMCVLLCSQLKSATINVIS